MQVEQSRHLIEILLDLDHRKSYRTRLISKFKMKITQALFKFRPEWIGNIPKFRGKVDIG